MFKARGIGTPDRTISPWRATPPLSVMVRTSGDVAVAALAELVFDSLDGLAP
jgi:hypothetical protein